MFAENTNLNDYETSECSNNCHIRLNRENQRSNIFKVEKFNNSQFNLCEQDNERIDLSETKTMDQTLKLNTPLSNSYDRYDRMSITFIFNVQTNNLPVMKQSFSTTTDMKEIYQVISETKYVKERSPQERDFNISFSPSWNSVSFPKTGAFENFFKSSSRCLTLYVNFQ